jgi:hypothetical protein
MITEEQLAAWESDIERQDNFLSSYGWNKIIQTQRYPWNGQEYQAEC